MLISFCVFFLLRIIADLKQKFYPTKTFVTFDKKLIFDPEKVFAFISSTFSLFTKFSFDNDVMR